jgi:hypothetical protein
VPGVNLTYRPLSLMKPYAFSAGLYPGMFLDGEPPKAASAAPVDNASIASGRARGILGDIMQLLCLKYRERLILDDRIKPSVKDDKLP